MKYISTKNYATIEIDVATAEMATVLDCYNSLFEMSDDGGAFPGSKAARSAKVYADQLRELIAARPEIVAYRDQKITAARNARLSGVDVMGV